MNHSHFIIKSIYGSAIAIIERDTENHLFTEKQFESIKHAVADELGVSPEDVIKIIPSQNDQANVYDDIEVEIHVQNELPLPSEYQIILQPTWLY